MTIKASGRSALILAAAGLWVCFAGPSQAANDTDDAAATTVKPVTHHVKKSAHHKSSRVSQHDATGGKSAEATADDTASTVPSAIPPSVANANAQLASPDTPAGRAQAMSTRANNILQAAADAQPAPDTPVVAADELNDVDRALRASTPPDTTVATAAADAPAAPVVAAGSNVSSTWDQTSLIGKIFIGFGALLTMASAARMFIA